MNALKVFAGLCAVFLTLPIWLYLLYKMMELTGATELMWFLYWVYVPFSFFIHAVTQAVAKKQA